MQVLFGGTFDPVHNGHVAMAMSLRDAFPDATIRVIPNRQPPHRSSRVSSAHRLAMLKLAMDEISGVTVDPIELGRDGPSYTVDTLCSLRAIYSEQEPIVLVYFLYSFPLLVVRFPASGRGPSACRSTSSKRVAGVWW